MGKEDPKPGKIELGMDELTNMLKSAVADGIAAGIKAAGPQQASALPPDQAKQVNDVLDGLRPKAPEGMESTVRCVSPDTGSTFDAIISRSNTYPEGRCVRLDKYAYPEDFRKRVPEHIWLHRPTEQDMPNSTEAQRISAWSNSKQYIWTNFWQADLRRFVGKPAAFLKHAVAA